MYFDLPLDQLKRYRPERTEPEDFDQFWKQSLTDACRFPLDVRFVPYEARLNTLNVYDVTFNGFAGQPIKGWLILPAHSEGPIACVVEFIGYGGGRGLPYDWLLWSAAGYANFVMDTRGQGSEWRNGDTPDCEPDGGNPQIPGFLTRGILTANNYYYRRVFIDAVRAVEAARSHPAVDAAQVAVTGVSQGGGISLAVAGLVPDLAAVMPDVPLLCHYRRATELVDNNPYYEISRYCMIHRDKIDTIFNTLSYFDGVNFAARATAPALFSVGLMDDVCPPSTVFAAYNHYAGQKEINIWPYNSHEGGDNFQNADKVKFLASLF